MTLPALHRTGYPNPPGIRSAVPATWPALLIALAWLNPPPGLVPRSVSVPLLHRNACVVVAVGLLYPTT